ncbi:kinesin-like protein KIN-12F [Phalaenopsis equestris]|uniref:kinesin-like protein KIN-12F n=1 Tax=Phalaenopsis equestris TaxID=78828 RepID=UPI0009E5BA95|nr:kinesin-like protein KIN-12F [Phalaenopsis equestris]
MKFDPLQRVVSICSLIGKQISLTISRLRNLLFTKSFSWSKLFPIRVLRELKFFRRNSGKNPTTDANNKNLPLEQTVSSASQQGADPSRLPFSAIQEPERNRKSGLDQETHLRRKSEKTPSKSQVKGSDQFLQSRTPDKLPTSKGRFGWVPIVEQAGLASPDRREYSHHPGQFQLPPPPPLMANHALNFGNGYSAATPRSTTTGGRASSVHSGTSSTQSTPTKSVSKPMINGVSNSRAPQCCGTVKAMNFLVSSKGIPLSTAPPPVYASVEVPHFELKEDPSFWMDHNVQVVIRVRPINIVERSQQGYSRCIKQESAQSITWIGQSKTRFMFDYIACETVNQEMLFRVSGLPMVENCMSGYNSCVFAYGQTGSGKTHTMLGEINDLEIRPSANRGMTPRIFEFLFARIKTEEENRRDEKLKYTCKCSFLQIYNEQIFDLLNPSSTNLIIRDDPRKGVHVENLSEFEVENVYDTLQLLIQGAANRKVAATMMNRESSRSHSVFTCTIESRWQKDSTSTLHFARLNLVDLAGSTRQKTSGAEGVRLKEASNINKSLSTLNHVIMVLAELANGRQRHVPYRDSRLTFLLQDSLGGNSKTMIIANVSPSICSANETLNTLKFAQRAKAIQNNVVVNENASGDAFDLHHQILLLKEELSMLKQQNISRSLSFRTETLEKVDNDAYSAKILPGILSEFNQIPDNEELQDVRVLNKQDLCLTSPEKVPCSCSTKHAEEVLYLEQELDRLKAIIAVEKSSRVEAEERAILSETKLSITNGKLMLIIKRCDATVDKLKDTRSVIEALESQQMLSINELEELRENNNRLADTVKIQEQQISTMKKQLALRVDVGNRKSIIAHEILREYYFESECSSPFQDKLKRVQASLEKAWNLNIRYQSDQASHSSSEREMDEVRRQVEAETAEVIVCLQEELTIVNHIVDECNKNELVAKQRLMDLEKEKKEQDDKVYLLTLENIKLAKLTEEKEQNASSIIEHWEKLAIDISNLLENGKTQLENATHEAASISNICSHKSWIGEQFEKIIIGISNRDSLIEELQKNLEDACYVRHDIESKLMALRGAILAFTEAQQQENSEKESRILHLTSLLAEKTSIISELEDKVEEAVRKVRNVEICAAIFFIIGKKLYEINKIHLQALDEANLQLRESERVITQKEDIMQGHASLLSIEGKRCQDQRANVEQNYQQANSLEHWKHDYLDTSSKNEEENIATSDSSCGLVEAKMKLREFQMQMSTLKSCMHEYADNQLVQCKSIISELNLHEEAQASEYNRKFKELEAMAFQLKTELVTSNTSNPTSTKSENGAAKSRGSGSPFKCMVGLAQQNSTEKDKEFTVARCKIDELEALAASRQNQIFMLNIRLAAAESMTHDVLRDLLGIKLDMTKYTMNGGSHSNDSMKEKGKELGELKRKVDELVEERKSLLEEINRSHRELIAAQIWLGKLEENEEFLSTENELLKADNAKLSWNLRRN